MGPYKCRSYKKAVLNRLNNLSTIFSVDLITTLDYGAGDYYPVYCITVGNGRIDSKEVLISAGIHGEEPAGVYALLEFLERDDILGFLHAYRFTIFPCINPFGFEYDYRFNPEGVNINRQFKPNTTCRESDLVIKKLASRIGTNQFTCTIDLHETDPNYVGEGFTQEDNPKEFYMWEVCPNRSLRIGDKVIKDIEGRGSVCKRDLIYGDKNNGGVIWYPEGCGNEVYVEGTTLEGFLANHYTPQAFTLETPCGWPIYQRISMHRAVLRSILKLKMNV